DKRRAESGGSVSNSETYRVPVRCIDGLSNRVENVYNNIARMVQKRIVVEPNTAIRFWGHGVLIEVGCANTDPAKIRVYMSPTALLILAPLQNGVSRWLFRYIRLETAVDNTDVSAQVEKGVLRISATHLNAPDDQKVQLCVA